MGKTNYLLKLLIALVISYLITGVATMVAAFFVYKMELGDKAIIVITSLIYSLASLSGGIYVGGKVEKKKLFSGMLLGLIYSIVIVLVGICVSKGGLEYSRDILLMFIISVISGGMGSLMRK